MSSLIDHYLNLKWFMTVFRAGLMGFLFTNINSKSFGKREHSLLIGPRTNILVRDRGSKINLIKVGVVPDRDPLTSPQLPLCAALGLRANWKYLFPGQSRETRVLVKSGAILTLEEYVHIYPGTYITVGNGAQLFIGSESVISNDSQINCRAGISIGAGSLIGAQTMLMDYDGHPIFHQDKPDLEETFGGEAKPIVIGKNVWVGFRSIILKGVTIGEGAIIGAGSCVTADVTSNTAVAGNPARVIKEGISWRRY